MANNPFRQHWRERGSDRQLIPPDWVAVDCPRCGQAIYSPPELVGKLICTRCMPLAVKMVPHKASEPPAEANGQKGGSNEPG
jgi:hypothetical protein